MLTLRTPIEMRLEGYESRRGLLEKKLQYVDKKVDWTLKKFKGGRRWFVSKYGEAAFDQRLAELQAERQKSLLFEDERGLWTYSGLRQTVADSFDDHLQVSYPIPKPELLPWTKEPDNKPRYYQTDAASCLLQASPFGPSAVEMGTGLGKTFILELLLKQIGLQAIVMAPTKSIGGQILAELTRHFGKSKVGYYGDGKKEFKKLITVGIAASLTKIPPGSPAWETLSKAKVFIADESHLCPATTLAKVCFGLAAAAPLRFFFSGTQVRNDGLDLLLDAITGPIVYRMSVQEGVDRGFLSKPVFRMCWVKSQMPCASDDANDLTRAHVFYNPDLNRKAAEIANKAVSMMGRPTLILVDELEQFSYLLPHFRYEARFAHGGVTVENRDKIPEEHHNSDPDALVADFNAGKFPILVGTSCIATGTDIQAPQAMLYLRGGKSETEVKQGVGRCTRLFPGKKDCIVFDFGVENVETLRRHAEARRDLYHEIYPSYSEIRI